jgi:hypothetical protein
MVVVAKQVDMWEVFLEYEIVNGDRDTDVRQPEVPAGLANCNGLCSQGDYQSTYRGHLQFTRQAAIPSARACAADPSNLLRVHAHHVLLLAMTRHFHPHIFTQ